MLVGHDVDTVAAGRCRRCYIVEDIRTILISVCGVSLEDDGRMAKREVKLISMAVSGGTAWLGLRMIRRMAA